MVALNKLRADARDLQQSSVRLIDTVLTLIATVARQFTVTTARWANRLRGIRIEGGLPGGRHNGRRFRNAKVRAAGRVAGLRGLFHWCTRCGCLHRLIGTLLGTARTNALIIDDSLAEQQEPGAVGTPLEVAFAQLRIEVETPWTAANLGNFLLLAHRESGAIQRQRQTRAVRLIGANIRPLRKRTLRSNQQDQTNCEKKSMNELSFYYRIFYNLPISFLILHISSPEYRAQLMIERVGSVAFMAMARKI